MSTVILVNAAQIVSPVSPAKPQRGKRMGDLRIWKNASLSLDAGTGNILDIGSWGKVKTSGARVVDAKGCVILPGLVDSHTHPVYAGSRVDEFFLRSQGKRYMDILKAGGGILSTVRETRKASGKVLLERAQHVLKQMLLHGTTTVEAKTGYGLSPKEEIRHLKILRALKRKLPLEIFSTFLGAHAVPPEYRGKTAEYVKLICDSMLPIVSKKKLADFCDVFCEKDVFSVDQSRRILQAAKKLGLGIRLHADEFESTGGAELGVSLEARSADHLMGISEQGIRAIAKSDTAAVLLPCTSLFLGNERYAPARKLIDAGTVVALATDFNAGSNLCYSMQMAASLGLLKMKMSPAEVLTASTLHGAYALGAAHRIGSLHPGKQADLVVFPGQDYRELFYQYGANHAKLVIKKGKVVA